MYGWSLLVVPAAATCVGAWGAFHPRSRLFGPSLSRTPNACALTFDDGPNAKVTPHLLDLLDKHSVRATFFVLGKYVQQNPGLAREIVARNHAIGNHTHTHPNTLFLGGGRILDELRRCEDAIFNATGRRSACVRPPFGHRGPQFHTAARTAGLSRIVMWSVSARDWTPQPWERISRRVANIGRGDIVLFHDGDHRRAGADRTHTLKTLEFRLPQWKQSGLEFTTDWPNSDVLE